MVWSSVKYQELHPVFQTVGPMAAWTSSLNCVVASSVTSTVVSEPSRNRLSHWEIQPAVSYEVNCSDIDPVGELGPSTVNRLGKPGIAVIR